MLADNLGEDGYIEVLWACPVKYKSIFHRACPVGFHYLRRLFMKTKFQSIRGTYDILPKDISMWQYMESILRSLMDRFNYSQIKIPTIEKTEVFTRSIGKETDIVNKEMYTFKHISGDSISLRPEGTAGVIRAYIQNSLYKKEKFSKLYYIGSMFRKERPQAGRNREFHQFGVEAIGSNSPYIDAEIITILDLFFKEIGLRNYELKINNLGCNKDKNRISKILRKELEPFKDQLCSDCNRRLKRNVLRILDCKKRNCKKVVSKIPEISELVCDDCKKYYDDFKHILDTLNIKFSHDNSIVRGLDYYTGPVFEITCRGIGSQDAIVAGGRYDNLIEQMGGPKIEAVGFALGIERLFLCLEDIPKAKVKLDIFIVIVDSKFFQIAFEFLYDLRKNGITADMDYTIPSIKGQMKQADKLGAKFVVLLGVEELRNKKMSIKNMTTGEQFQVGMDKFIEEVKKLVR